jgi:hypothetical protein
VFLRLPRSEAGGLVVLRRDDVEGVDALTELGDVGMAAELIMGKWVIG